MSWANFFRPEARSVNVLHFTLAGVTVSAPGEETLDFSGEVTVNPDGEISPGHSEGVVFDVLHDLPEISDPDVFNALARAWWRELERGLRPLPTVCVVPISFMKVAVRFRQALVGSAQNSLSFVARDLCLFGRYWRRTKKKLMSEELLQVRRDYSPYAWLEVKRWQHVFHLQKASKEPPAGAGLEEEGDVEEDARWLWEASHGAREAQGFCCRLAPQLVVAGSRLTGSLANISYFGKRRQHRLLLSSDRKTKGNVYFRFQLSPDSLDTVQERSLFAGESRIHTLQLDLGPTEIGAELYAGEVYSKPPIRIPYLPNIVESEHTPAKKVHQ